MQVIHLKWAGRQAHSHFPASLYSCLCLSPYFFLLSRAPLTPPPTPLSPLLPFSFLSSMVQICFEMSHPTTNRPILRGWRKQRREGREGDGEAEGDLERGMDWVRVGERDGEQKGRGRLMAVFHSAGFVDQYQQPRSGSSQLLHSAKQNKTKNIFDSAHH